ncbi:MAG: pentapeptide repeat-containing protein [Saprospiraceae bacterium]|nr:pentapeptide repeat-containing protein [Saprospiraceae bacterium]
MRINRSFIYFLLLTLTSLCAWFLGYIKVPYVDVQASFWAGFISALCFILLGLCFIWFIGSKLSGPNDGEKREMAVDASLIKRIFWLMLAILCLIFLCAQIYYFLKKPDAKLQQIQQESNEWKIKANVESERSKIMLLAELIRQLDSFKLIQKDSVQRKFMIDRVAAVSATFNLKKEFDAERAYSSLLSAERGLLLLSLLHTKMDSLSFRRIKENVSFSGADLRNADLQGFDLSGIDLRWADLKHANLRNCNLNDAVLSAANLYGADLDGATLYGANLISAKMQWSKMNHTELSWTRLDSADLSNASFFQSKLVYATFIRTKFYNALLKQADLNNGFFVEADLSFANFSGSVLSHASFEKTKVKGMVLNDAVIDTTSWKEFIGAAQLENDPLINNYKLVADSLSVKDSVFYKVSSK